MVLYVLGHALAMWLCGGSLVWIEINPLSWSYSVEGTASSYPLVSALAGMVFACGVSLTLAVFFWRRQTFFAPIFIVTAVISWVSNGLYYIIDATLDAWGEPFALVELGLQETVVVSIGVLLVIVGLFLGKLTLARMTKGFAVVTRIIIVMGGIYPYLLAMCIYQFFNSTADIIYITIAAILTPLLADTTRPTKYLNIFMKNAHNITSDWRTITASYSGAFIIILFCTLILPAWWESRVMMTTESKILYFQNKNHYIATFTTRPDTPTIDDFGKMWLKPWEVVIFWNIDGNIGQWHCPKTDEEELLSSFTPTSAFYSHKLDGLVAQNYYGIYKISLHNHNVNWIWYPEDMVIIGYPVLSPNQRYYVMKISRVTDDILSYSIAGFDLTTQNSSSCPVSTLPKCIAFVNDNQAVASGGINPIYITFEDSGQIDFKGMDSIPEDYCIEGSIAGQLVTSIDSDQFQFHNGSVEASVDSSMWAKVGNDSFLWVLSWEREVFRINTEGQKQWMGKVDEGIVDSSYGILEDAGIWVATGNNRVYLFGESLEIIEIPDPNVSVEIRLE